MLLSTNFVDIVAYKLLCLTFFSDLSSVYLQPWFSWFTHYLQQTEKLEIHFKKIIFSGSHSF